MMQAAKATRALIYRYQKMLNIPSIRPFSASHLLQQSSVTKKHDHIILKDENNSSLEIAHFWLRDHCHCSECYNHVTNQREFDLLKIDRKISPIKLETDKNKLTVVWSDEHESIYDINWIFNQLSPSRKRPKGVQKVFWNAEKIKSVGIPTVPYKEFMQTSGFVKHLINIIMYGFSCVVEAPPTYEATKEICTRTAFVDEMYAGTVFQWSNEKIDFADSTYSTESLTAHTDTTYFTQTAGFQVFHCLEHDGLGGETLLVDGFQVMQELKEENNEAFEFLRKVRIPHHFLEKDQNIYAEMPILETNSESGEFLQIRFNPLDRAPLTNFIDVKSVNKFYESYISLMRIIRKKENELYYKLRPGTVIVINNFRVLHGRTAFTGKRVMVTSFLDRDDLFSRARLHGLL